MSKYYIQYDGEFIHHYKVLNDFTLLHVNETSACINHTHNDVKGTNLRYTISNEETFVKALEKTLNNLGINYGNFKFI